MQQLYQVLGALGLPEQSEGFPGSVLVVSTRGAVGTKCTSALEFGHALHLPEPHQNPGMGPMSVQSPGLCHQLRAPRPDSSGVCHSFSVFGFFFFFFPPLISTNLSQGGMFLASLVFVSLPEPLDSFIPPPLRGFVSRVCAATAAHICLMGWSTQQSFLFNPIDPD